MGTRLKFRVRRENQEGRSGKHPLADVLEIRYVILDQRLMQPPISQCTEIYLSTKTYFTLQLPETAAGKWAYFYCRWRNFSKEENSGTFCNMIMAFVA